VSALLGEPDVDWVEALRDEVRALLRTTRHRGAEAALRTEEVLMCSRSSPPAS
jgi:hypothetical protein